LLLSGFPPLLCCDFSWAAAEFARGHLPADSSSGHSLLSNQNCGWLFLCLSLEMLYSYLVLSCYCAVLFPFLGFSTSEGQPCPSDGLYDISKCVCLEPMVSSVVRVKSCLCWVLSCYSCISKFLMSSVVRVKSCLCWVRSCYSCISKFLMSSVVRVKSRLCWVWSCYSGISKFLVNYVLRVNSSLCWVLCCYSCLSKFMVNKLYESIAASAENYIVIHVKKALFGVYYVSISDPPPYLAQIGVMVFLSKYRYCYC
jgi:hypothetical protein